MTQLKGLFRQWVSRSFFCPPIHLPTWEYRAFDQLAGALRQSMLYRNQPQPFKEAYGRVMGLIQGQATTLAYIDVISIMAIAVFLLPPFILFMRRPKAAGTPPAIH